MLTWPVFGTAITAFGMTWVTKQTNLAGPPAGNDPPTNKDHGYVSQGLVYRKEGRNRSGNPRHRRNREAEAAKIETVIISVEKQALDEVKAVEASVTAAISKFERLIPQLTAEIASKNSALSAAQDALARLKAMVSPPAVQAAPSAPVVPVAPVQPVADQVVVG